MGITSIEWADYTFNPWIGCSKISPGCANCYAERDFAIRRRRVIWGPNGTRDKTSSDYWRQPFTWNRQAANQAERPRVFCGSLCDVFEQFDNDVRPLWRAQLFNVIAQTPNLDWLLLTKRPQNVLRMLAEVKVAYGWGHAVALAARWLAGDPPANVWLGVSVENQTCADERIPELLQIPAAVRFLSIEPLLGPVDLRSIADDGHNAVHCLTGNVENPNVDWVIVGGESGPHARPMHPAWARLLRDQCAAVGVPFFFKQWGEYAPDGQDDIAPEGTKADCAVVYADQLDRDPEAVFRMGRQFAGRLLDGRVWSEFPTPQPGHLLQRERV